MHARESEGEGGERERGREGGREGGIIVLSHADGRNTERFAQTHQQDHPRGILSVRQEAVHALKRKFLRAFHANTHHGWARDQPVRNRLVDGARRRCQDGAGKFLSGMVGRDARGVSAAAGGFREDSRIAR